MLIKLLGISWKTTASGIGLVLTGLGKAVGEFAAGGITAIDFSTFVTSIIGGVGLITAKDHNVTGGTRNK
jgi:hypothetical protein